MHLYRLSARPGSMRIPDSEEKVRRAAEREGRRRARRLKREAGMHSLEHREGDSSDDELTTVELQHYRTETGERDLYNSYVYVL